MTCVVIKTEITCFGIKLILRGPQQEEFGRAFLYILKNDLHTTPFGLMEDVWIDPSIRGQGQGTRLIKLIIETARQQGCYKLIATSRYPRLQVHELYTRLGFVDHGKEFRMDL